MNDIDRRIESIHAAHAAAQDAIEIAHLNIADIRRFLPRAMRVHGHTVNEAYEVFRSVRTHEQR